MRRLFQAYLNSHSKTAQFLRFATVGIKISIIDIGGVYLLPWLFGLHLYSARIISLSSALLVGYFLNRHFTFGKAHRGRFYHQLIGHFSVHLTGAALNYGIFTLIVEHGRTLFASYSLLPILPLVALWIGGVVGIAFNFVVSKRFVFRAATEPEEASCEADVFGTPLTQRKG